MYIRTYTCVFIGNVPPGGAVNAADERGPSSARLHPAAYAGGLAHGFRRDGYAVRTVA